MSYRTPERKHPLPVVLWNHDRSFRPDTNFKIVSAIRSELSQKMVIEDLQEVLAQAWRPLLCDKHVCMTDATCYESHLRFPTDMKLLWESVEWLHRQIIGQCSELHIRRPRNKFDDVSRVYLSYCKKRKRKTSRTRMLKRRLLHLWKSFFYKLMRYGRFMVQN